MSSPVTTRPLSAVVVDHDSGPVLTTCVASLVDEGVREVVVVDNGGRDDPLARLPSGAEAHGVAVVRTGRNLGYGAGANRGVAALGRLTAAGGGAASGSGSGPAAAAGGGAASGSGSGAAARAGRGAETAAARLASEVVLVMNPDVRLHPGAAGALAAAVLADPTVGVAGPQVLEPDGSRYPSARRFPSPLDALVHAVAGRLLPANRFSRRYRMADLGTDRASPVDWVSGACFAVRRSAWEELGGFDEAYFMYAEDMDLCWRARRAGWSVVFEPAATVTHLQGVSTRRRPYAMVLAHHRSAVRFTWRTQLGWRRALVPGAVVVLATRMVAEIARLVFGGEGRGGWSTRARHSG